MRQTMRLDKVLSNSGYGTRKEVKQLVKKGAVSVDGEVARDGGMHVDPENCTIEVNGELLNYRRFVYVMMNKPCGIVSATWDDKYATVVDILPDRFKHFNLFPVGRLDIDTEGLILLTNDGKLAHELLSPRKHVAKRYYALVDGTVTSENIMEFRESIVLEDGYRTLPADLSIIKTGKLSEVELVLYEGKFHQVKRMFQALGKKVKYLKRIEMGGLGLDEGLKPGECRELTEDEVKRLMQISNDKAQNINMH